MRFPVPVQIQVQSQKNDVIIWKSSKQIERTLLILSFQLDIQQTEYPLRHPNVGEDVFLRPSHPETPLQTDSEIMFNQLLQHPMALSTWPVKAASSYQDVCRASACPVRAAVPSYGLQKSTCSYFQELVQNPSV